MELEALAGVADMDGDGDQDLVAGRAIHFADGPLTASPYLPAPLHRLSAATTVAAAVAASIWSASAAESSANSGVFFDDIRVFDGQRVHAKLDVLVRDGRIAAVGAALKPPAGVER